MFSTALNHLSPPLSLAFSLRHRSHPSPFPPAAPGSAPRYYPRSRDPFSFRPVSKIARLAVLSTPGSGSGPMSATGPGRRYSSVALAVRLPLCLSRHLRVRARYTRVCTRGQHAGVHARTDREQQPVGRRAVRTVERETDQENEYIYVYMYIYAHATTRWLVEMVECVTQGGRGSIEKEIAALGTVGGHVSGRIY